MAPRQQHVPADNVASSTHLLGRDEAILAHVGEGGRSEAEADSVAKRRETGADRHSVQAEGRRP